MTSKFACCVLGQST